MDRVEASTPPPIFKLNYNVLLEIFTLVIHNDRCIMGRHRSMYKNVSSISAVCSFWRQLALEAPILWSLINLQMFEDTSQRWRTEVLRRSKRSPLILNGTLSIFSEPEILSFFKSVVQDNWSRIEAVDLAISPIILATPTRPGRPLDINELRELFGRSAPMLTSFSLKIPLDDDQVSFFPNPIPIFMHGEVPVLTKFESKQFYLGYEGLQSRFSHLSRLTIACPPSVSQVLALLQNIPSLTELSLHCTHDIPSTISQGLPHVAPPHLRSLSIRFFRGTFIPFIDLLDHIHPFQRISLNLSCRLRGSAHIFDMDTSQTETFRRALQKFFPTAFAFADTNQGRLVTRIHVQVNEFRMMCHDPEANECQPSLSGSFFFSLYFPHLGALRDIDMAQLMGLFSSCDFSGINKAVLMGNFHAAMPAATDPNDTRMLFFRKFISVEVVEMDSVALSYFSDKKINLHTVFPRLRVVKQLESARGRGFPIGDSDTNPPFGPVVPRQNPH